MKLNALAATAFFAVIALVPVAHAGSCNWLDGQDPAGPSNDRGRGVSDWTQHYGYVANGSGPTSAYTLISGRMKALKECLVKEKYATLYADLSTLVGFYGRASAGWVDGSDGNAPADDTGRGTRDWSAHYSYVVEGQGYGTADRLVGDRFNTLSQKLSKSQYAHLYADTSVLMANFARMRGHGITAENIGPVDPDKCLPPKHMCCRACQDAKCPSNCQ